MCSETETHSVKGMSETWPLLKPIKTEIKRDVCLLFQDITVMQQEGTGLADMEHQAGL